MSEQAMDNMDDFSTSGADTTAMQGDGLDSLMAMDFDIDAEYKPEPFVPKATYKGFITEVKYLPDKFCLEFRVTLNGNSGVMSDGLTPIDGNVVPYKLWMPKPGDEMVPSNNGRSNKRQNKMNKLGEFKIATGIAISRPVEIVTAIRAGVFMGMPVEANVSLSEFEGNKYNEVSKLRKAA